MADVQLRYPGISTKMARRFMLDVGAIDIGRDRFVRPGDLLAFEASELQSGRLRRSALSESPRGRGYWLGEAA